MKKSSLTAISMPEQAKLMREINNDLEFSRTDHIKTGTIVKWSSGVIVTGYPAGIMAFIGVGPWPWLALSFGIASASMAMVSLGTIFTDSARRMKENLRLNSRPIELEEWKSQTTKPKGYSGETYRGIKISQRSRRSLIVAALHPMRPFRKILLHETIWYDPNLDCFRRECSYMGLFNWIHTEQIYSGRRRTFGTTLNTLQVKTPEISQEKAQVKS
jgi:hypothetical protein